jgi:hypothetical protein
MNQEEQLVVTYTKGKLYCKQRAAIEKPREEGNTVETVSKASNMGKKQWILNEQGYKVCYAKLAIHTY